jgi:rsbT co-antagonist protein RsbR
MSLDREEDEPLAIELKRLRERVAALERQAADARQAERMLREKTAEQAALLNAIPAVVFLKDREHRYLLVNQAYADSVHRHVDEIIGKRDSEIMPPERARTYHENDEAVMASEVPRMNVELSHKCEDGSVRWALENDVPYRDASGRVIGMVGVAFDVTARKLAEEALQRAEAELRATLERQQALLDTIAALSTPILPVHDRILVVPLIGHIDAARSARIMEAVLSGVQRHGAGFVIVDLTGVPLVDAAVAEHLLRAARAVALLGAECILVGLSPLIARSLAQLGVDLQALVTLGDLQAGMRYALSRDARAAAPAPFK